MISTIVVVVFSQSGSVAVALEDRRERSSVRIMSAWCKGVILSTTSGLLSLSQLREGAGEVWTVTYVDSAREVLLLSCENNVLIASKDRTVYMSSAVGRVNDEGALWFFVSRDTDPRLPYDVVVIRNVHMPQCALQIDVSTSAWALSLATDWDGRAHWQIRILDDDAVNKVNSTAGNKGEVVQIRSKAIEGLCLACMADGSVQGVLAPADVTGDTRLLWRPVEFGVGEVFLTSVSGDNRNLQCEQHGHISTHANRLSWELWHIEDSGLGDESVFIENYFFQGCYISSNSNGTLGMSTNKLQGERWYLKRNVLT